MSIYFYFYQDELLYIGSSIDIKSRMDKHISDLKVNKLPFHKYLNENHLTFEDLDFEDVKTDINDEEQLRLLEGDCQRLYKPLCNVRTEGRTKKEYREDNKEYLKEYQKKYRIDNKERKKAYHIINYSNNSEKYIKKAKLYRDTNKDSISLNKKKYYQENKEEINRKNRERRAKKKLEKLAVIQE